MGILHHTFFSTGDILKDYAILGAILLLFRDVSDRTLLVAAALSLFLPSAAASLIEFLGIPRPPRIDPAITARMLAEGSYLDRVSLHLSSLPGKWRLLATSSSYYLVMFLLRFYAARRRLLDGPGKSLPLLRRILDHAARCSRRSPGESVSRIRHRRVPGIRRDPAVSCWRFPYSH
jgi:uncharacterized protein